LKSQIEGHQGKGAIIDRRTEDFAVISILMSREVEVGSRVKSIAEVSAYMIEGKSILVLQVNGISVYIYIYI